MQIKYEFAIRTRIRFLIKRLLIVLPVYLCILKLSLTKKHIWIDTISTFTLYPLLLNAWMISIQIMTDHEGNRNIERFRRAWKQLTIAWGEAEGNSQLFPGPPESREPDGYFCWPRDQSLFVLLYHYMPTVHKIVIYNKLTKMSLDTFQFKVYFKK